MTVQENTQEIVVKTDDVKDDSLQKGSSSVTHGITEPSNKVFIGNLSFKTTEEDLRTLFEGIGSITAINMPMRRLYKTGGYRSQGIAFISFSSKDDAQKAIDVCNKKELLDRTITVTYANPQQGRSTARRQKNTRYKTKLQKKNRGHDSKEAVDAKTKKTNAAASVNSDSNVSGTQKQADQVASSGGAAEVDAKPNRVRFTRLPMRRGPKGPPVDGVNSKTTVFVAGLSYDTREEQLFKWFSTYNPQSVHIALRPLPRYMVERLEARGEQRKGRGFGFVTFENEDMQNKAVEEMNDKEIDGRKLTVKVAIDKPYVSQIAVNGSQDLGDGNTVAD